MAGENRHEARRRKTGERIGEVEHSDSEETSIDAFKRIRFDSWASDRRKGQEEVSEIAEANKRQYMNDVPFNSAPHMMANDGGLLKTPEHLLAEYDAARLLMESGINPSNLSDSQLAVFQQQESIHIYAQNLAKNQRQQVLSSAGEMSHQDSPLTYQSEAKFSSGVTPVAASNDTLQDMKEDSRLNAIDLLTKNGYHSDNSPDSSWLLDDSRGRSLWHTYITPPERSPTPEYLSRSSNLKSKGKKRHPKAQASQGDAVLIGFVGGLNHPDLATEAGETPLPQSDDSDVDDPMNREEKK